MTIDDPRLSINPKNSGLLILPVMTYHQDEHEFSGTYHQPNVPILIFADSDFRAPFVYHGGPVGGVSTPIQLVFWGAWWTSGVGAQRAAMVEARTKAMLDSHYFDELTQYFIALPPVWRGSTFVTQPAAPGAVTAKDAQKAVLDLIDDLIDDDVFPDPDDGPRIGFIALMPEGFVCTDADGSHLYDYDWDFPFDKDNYWAGWCRYYDAAREDPETMMQTVGHEIAEMLTDPEVDGWHTDLKDDPEAEIADIALSSGVFQTAWVNGVNVQAYWSNRHSACVIPIDRDYRARLSGSVVEQSRKTANHGTFRPDPSDSAACSTAMPECCMEDRDYVWVEYSVTETATVKLGTTRYRQPVATWTIEGQQVTDNGQLTVSVDLDKFDGRDTVSVPDSGVVLQYVASNTTLEITAAYPGGNFDVQVGCSVSDGSIKGNVAANVIASPQVTVGFVGAVIEIEKAYLDQREACVRKMLDRYIVQYQPTGKTSFRGDPINYDPGIDQAVLPAYARVSQYDRVREAVKVIRAANQLLDAEATRVFVDNLIAGIPALAGAMNRLRTTQVPTTAG